MSFVKILPELFTIIEAQGDINWKRTLFEILIYATVLYMYDTLYAILNKSENATLQYTIFVEKYWTNSIY